MTHEQRSKWIQRSFLLVLSAAILAGVWFYRDKIHTIKAPVVQVAKPRHAMEIIHFHVPGQADSERLADHLNQVETKYTGQVRVTRVDVTTQPERAKAEQVTRPPEVLIMTGTSRAFRFQGLWPRDRIEQRVEEILRGLRRMEKDWMPPGISRR